MQSRLFEQLLREDKTRFVNKAFSYVYGPDFLKKYGGDINGYDYNDIIKFVNSSAVDKYKIDWQEEPDTLYNDILDAYEKYDAAGGSRAQQAKSLKGDPKKFFTKNRDLSKKKDYVFLPSLENETFFFVQPLSYKCCVFMDSFKCGGQGAKWCLGYEKTSDYWWSYCGENNLFVFAFNKKEFASKSDEEDKLKYMVQLSPSKKETQVWKQSDHESETVKTKDIKTLLGYSADEILEAVLTEGNLEPVRNKGAWSRAKSLLSAGKPYYKDREKYSPNYPYTIDMKQFYDEFASQGDGGRWYFNYMAKQQANEDSKRVVLDYDGVDLEEKTGGAITFPLAYNALDIRNFDEVVIINLDAEILRFKVNADQYYGASHDRPEFAGKLTFENCGIGSVAVSPQFMQSTAPYMKVLFDESCSVGNVTLNLGDETSKEDIRHAYNMFNTYDGVGANISIFDSAAARDEGKEIYYTYEEYMGER